MLIKKSLAGFSLVEMAIVLAIVGLLLGGLIPTLSAQMESQRINETRKQLDEIQQALIGYAIINGRLPCPAKATLASGLANAGVEATTGNTCACTATGNYNADNTATACTLSTVTGVLPWATLGIKETDAWERRYTYRVTTHFADQIAANTFGTGCTPSPAPTASSFALCSSSSSVTMPYVRSADSGGTNVADDVPAIFLSHGKNGAGAYLSNGTQLAVSTVDDEAENSDNDNKFVSHNITSNFDDLVVWLSPNTLLNRMVTAGKLP